MKYNGIVNINYFKELEEQIIDESKWNKDKFIVFDHEAGTGKSRFAQQFLGEMTNEQKYKVLYVQKFKKDNELVQTVERINHFAEVDVADYYSSDRKKGYKEKAVKAQILCITHRLYQEICRGNHTELIKDRDILVIDEFPQIMEEVIVGKEDIANLWKEFYALEENSGKELAERLMEILLQNQRNTKYNEMFYIDFQLPRYEYLRELLSSLISDYEALNNNKKRILDKMKTLLNQGFFISDNKFISWNREIQMVKLKNNIILDANAGFDYRYSISSEFEVKRQDRIMDYSNTTIKHYQVKTSKSSLDKYNTKLFEKAMTKIDWKQINKILFVTDIGNEEVLEKEILSYLRFHGNTLQEIEKNYNKQISIDHFGNLIGKNLYMDYDSIAILKTPNYKYSSYVIEYGYFNDNIKNAETIIPFMNPQVETLRKTILAGHIYQATKRINRKNQLEGKIYLFCDLDEPTQIVREQLKNVRYQAFEFDMAERNYNKENRPPKQLNELKEILLNYKKSGIKEITKQEISKQMNIKAPNLSKLLRKVQGFANKNGIKIEKGRKIVFNY